jgi:hypothetical protein
MCPGAGWAAMGLSARLGLAVGDVLCREDLFKHCTHNAQVRLHGSNIQVKLDGVLKSVFNDSLKFRDRYQILPEQKPNVFKV